MTFDDFSALYSAFAVTLAGAAFFFAVIVPFVAGFLNHPEPPNISPELRAMLRDPTKRDYLWRAYDARRR